MLPYSYADTDIAVDTAAAVSAPPLLLAHTLLPLAMHIYAMVIAQQLAKFF